jgi:multisubunit Na+/H+ antiporter MnhG subunit
VRTSIRIQTKITVLYEVLNIIAFIRVMCQVSHNQVISMFLIIHNPIEKHVHGLPSLHSDKHLICS